MGSQSRASNVSSSLHGEGGWRREREGGGREREREGGGREGGRERKERNS
jgi:hypothetical protein